MTMNNLEIKIPIQSQTTLVMNEMLDTELPTVSQEEIDEIIEGLAPKIEGRFCGVPVEKDVVEKIKPNSFL